LDCESKEKINQGRDRNQAHGRGDGMGRAARTPQASVDQCQARNGERNQQNEKETKQERIFCEDRGHSRSSVAGRCVLATKPSPRSSVIVPATTNADSAPPCKSASALITIAQP